MIVQPDSASDFLPIPDELLVNLTESKSLILDLLEKLPLMFEDTTYYESNI